MSVMEIIKKRKSVRAFLDREIEPEKLDTLLEAARLAPSASNRQEWRFIIVRKKEMRQELAKAANGQTFIGQAPVVIVACAETNNHVMACGQLCYPIDVAISLDHLSLTATEMGIGSCWIGAFDEEKVKSLLGIPNTMRVVELMPLGYPKDPAPVMKNRRAIDEIVRHEKW